MAVGSTTRPRMYFNLRSPYSWLTLHDLTMHHPDLLKVMEWRPYWEQDPAVVAEIGAAIGLDPARLVQATDNPDLVAAGTRAFVDVYRDGVFGVPYFVYGRARFWGLDRLDAFVTSFRHSGQAGRELEPEPEPIPGTVAMAISDDGHAGGCG